MKDLKPDIPIAIIGNKCDLEHAVTTQTATDYCAEKKFAFWETSALDGTGVNLSFQNFVKTVKVETEAPKTIKITNAPPTNVASQKAACCKS